MPPEFQKNTPFSEKTKGRGREGGEAGRVGYRAAGRIVDFIMTGGMLVPVYPHF